MPRPHHLPPTLGWLLVFAGCGVVGCGSGDGSETEPPVDTGPSDATGDTGEGVDSTTDSGVADDADAGPDAAGDSSPGDVVDAPVATSVRFAVIGDYGDDGTPEADVAKLVKGWKVDFVIAAGDNNYPAGAASTIDPNIGKHYAEFIGAYKGAFGKGSTENRFWPVPGNHDWMAAGLKPYLDYFTLPGIERYYHVETNPGFVHLFQVDSDSSEPDGATETSTQGKWLQAQMTASKACWKFVTFHHPAYNSGSSHGSTTRMRWPFKTWGADAVFQGHEHVYERLEAAGLLYITSGLGGAGRYAFGTALPESKFRYAADWGALLVVVDKTKAVFEFWNRAGTKIDSTTLTKSCP